MCVRGEMHRILCKSVDVGPLVHQWNLSAIQEAEDANSLLDCVDRSVHALLLSTPCVRVHPHGQVSLSDSDDELFWIPITFFSEEGVALLRKGCKSIHGDSSCSCIVLSPPPPPPGGGPGGKGLPDVFVTTFLRTLLQLCRGTNHPTLRIECVQRIRSCLSSFPFLAREITL